MNRRQSYRLVLAAAVAAWLALAFVTPRPANPTPDPALRLEAHDAVPAPVLDVLRHACFDCHSDETRWPWYTRAFPASWLMSRDVDAARRQMNFSRWFEYNRFDRADMLDAACHQVRRGDMPLAAYRLLHRRARLTGDQVETLCAWTSQEATRLAGEEGE